MIPWAPRNELRNIGPVAAKLSPKAIYRVHPQSPRLNGKLLRSANPSDIEKEVKRILKKQGQRHVPISGMRQVLDNKDGGVCKRIFWAFATAICLAFSFYFVSQQLIRYQKTPTSLKTIIERSARIKVPGIAVCPGLPGLINEKAVIKFKNACEKSNQVENCENVPFKKLEINIEDIWNATQVKEYEVHVEVECPDDHLAQFTPCVVPTIMAYFDSFWGSCVSFSPRDKNQLYHGPQGIYNVTIDSDDGVDQSFRMFLHDTNYAHNHDSFFNSRHIITKQIISINLEPKEFRMLTKHKEKCVDTEQTINCVNRCLDDKITRVVNCSLPFIMSKLHPPCSTWNEALTALKKAATFYRKTTKLACLKCGNRCKETLYPMGFNNIGHTGNNSTHLLFYYEDNTWQTIEEVLDYPFMSFISEVGGILGFFIGFSVLCAMETIQHLYYGLKKFSRSHCRCLY